MTLADRHYLEPAKQVLASAYHRGAWRSDYLLLAHQLAESDTAWFRDRGVLVHDCESLMSGQVGGLSPVMTSKLHLFTPEFRRWSAIVYVDADSMVRSSLDDLTAVAGFHSVVDWNPTLKLQIASRGAARERRVRGDALAQGGRVLHSYDLDAPAFCAGFFAFAPGSIEPDCFRRLLHLLRMLRDVSRFGDQLAFNVQFYRRWRRLAPAHSVLLHNDRSPWPVRSRHLAGARVLHLTGSVKPWLERSGYHREWTENRARAETTDFRLAPAGVARVQPEDAGPLQRRLAVSRYIRRRLAALHRPCLPRISPGVSRVRAPGGLRGAGGA